MQRFVPLFVSLSFLLPTGTRADWPQFRGPGALGASEAKVPVEWSAEKNITWTANLPGPGSSSPVISGDAVFVTSYSGAGAEVRRHLLRLDLTTGETVWEQTVGVQFPEDPAEGYINEHGFASNTPVTDGEAVYCYFGKAGVHAFDFDGKRLWSAETGALSSDKKWGSASSPILHGDLLIVPAGDEARSILAFRKDSGEEVWRFTHPTTEETYGTPVIVRVNESRTDLVFAAATRWIGLDPATGAEVWFANYNLPGNMSNTTHVSGDILTVSGGFPRTARVAVKTGGVGDITGGILYDTQKPTTYMTMPVEHDGVLYWISDSGIAFAAEPGAGEPLWQERVPDLDGAGGRGSPFYASPVVAGGKIYAVSRANGTFVIEPSREGLKLLAHNRIAGDETLFNATPAVSGGKLLIRSQDRLYCISE